MCVAIAQSWCVLVFSIQVVSLAEGLPLAEGAPLALRSGRGHFHTKIEEAQIGLFV